MTANNWRKREENVETVSWGRNDVVTWLRNCKNADGEKRPALQHGRLDPVCATARAPGKRGRWAPPRTRQGGAATIKGWPTAKGELRRATCRCGGGGVEMWRGGRGALFYAGRVDPVCRCRSRPPFPTRSPPCCWRCILVHLACSLHFGLNLIMELTRH
jgi:hypothetical protein